jgi:hypothetical protein
MIPTIKNNPLENFQLNLPEETTTATLTQFYEQWSDSWEIATQQVDTNGTIVSRNYSLLSFPYNEAKLVKIELGSYDPQWEANFYYTIISYFKETSYSSHYKYTLPFNEWKKQETKFRQEALYKHKLTNTLTWTRPTISLPDVLPIEYQSLEEDYTLLINVGQALGATIQIADLVEVRLKSTDSDIGELVNKDFVLLTKPYLEITFKDITLTSHTELTVNFYGEYAYRTYVPANLFNQEEQLTLIHPFNTSYQDRLKPPGLANLPDNFWNTNYDQLPNIELAERATTPQWL